jgi:peptide/nickel transport system permease protein
MGSHEPQENRASTSTRRSGQAIGNPDHWLRLRRTLRPLVRNRLAMLGSGLLLALLLVAFLAPAIAPYSYKEIHVRDALRPPNPQYLLGTDEFGRDLLSRIIYGSRISLKVGALAVVVAMTTGTILGLAAGFCGGWISELIMRFMDVLFAFPPLLLAIVFMSILGPTENNVLISVGIVYSPIFARLARGSTLAIMALPYVSAARAIGASGLRIAFRHVLPNCVSPIIVQASASLGYAILFEAALSFLGLGTQPPLPSWGLMINIGRQYFYQAPWIAIFPGVAIMLTVLAFNLLGDGLRDIMDKRSSDR